MALHYAENITHFDFVKGTLQLILCGKGDFIFFYLLFVVVENSLVIVIGIHITKVALHYLFGLTIIFGQS